MELLKIRKSRGIYLNNSNCEKVFNIYINNVNKANQDPSTGLFFIVWCLIQLQTYCHLLFICFKTKVYI